MCECMERVNASLRERNTKLSVTFCLSKDLSEADTMLLISTEKVDTRSRVKPIHVIPTFCPFCGVKYPRKDAAQAPEDNLTDAAASDTGSCPHT